MFAAMKASWTEVHVGVSSTQGFCFSTDVEAPTPRTSRQLRCRTWRGQFCDLSAIAESQNLRMAEWQNGRMAELQNCRLADSQNCRLEVLQNLRITESQNHRNKSGGSKGGGPEGWEERTQKKWRRVEGAKGGDPKISRVFFFRRKFRSFISLWGLLVELWSRFKAQVHPKCAFRLLWGHFVRAPAAPQAAGVSQTDSREPKRALLVVHGLEPRPQFHEETPRET